MKIFVKWYKVREVAYFLTNIVSMTICMLTCMKRQTIN